VADQVFRNPQLSRVPTMLILKRCRHGPLHTPDGEAITASQDNITTTIWAIISISWASHTRETPGSCIPRFSHW
jgi:hypothetical protein